jgi:hypothetical protein
LFNNVLNPCMLRCVGNAKESGDKLQCIRICYSVIECSLNIFVSRLIQHYFETFSTKQVNSGYFERWNVIQQYLRHDSQL